MLDVCIEIYIDDIILQKYTYTIGFSGYMIEDLKFYHKIPKSVEQKINKWSKEKYIEDKINDKKYRQRAKEKLNEKFKREQEYIDNLYN